jgi:membrane-bound serine protease (ClpP class)
MAAVRRYTAVVVAFRRASLAAIFLLGGTAPVYAQAGDARPVALVAELDGIIHPVSAEYLTDVIDESDTSGAVLVVLVLRTPGGLLESTRTIVSRMITSRAPVVVFVAPSGARAASAGFIITLAADVAAMAPGTHIGAAHPVSGGGQQTSDVMESKAAADTAAYARSLASARGRNVDLSGKAVFESRAFTEREALDAKPPLIDLVASDLDRLLRDLKSRTIRRFDGRTMTLPAVDVEVRRVEMTTRQRFLSAIAHPQVAYILMTLGLLGLTVELWNPGAVLPGVVGVLSLLLAFFAFQVIPMGTAGLLLILFGIALLLAELAVPSGLLGVGGTIALTIGSIMATRQVPGVQVHPGAILPAALALAAAILLLGRLALQAQRRAPQTGAEAMIGDVGRTRSPLAPDVPGQIDARGEIWRAVSSTALPAGAPVRIVGMDGLTLSVEPLNDRPPEGAH